MNIAANIIRLLHILLVLFLIITPFTDNEPLIVLEFIVLPFIFLHWILGDDTCCLTVAESMARGLTLEEAKNGESFFHNLVSPVYKISDKDTRQVAWGVGIILWLITLFKIIRKPQMIKDMFTNAKKVLKGERLEVIPSSSV
jgi:hypothetical protein